MEETEQEHPEITKGRKMYDRYKGVKLLDRRFHKLPKNIKKGILLERVRRGDLATLRLGSG